jgi:antitoxin YefM
MMSRTLPISEVKARLPELVTGVEDREEEVVVTRKGKPVAMLVNYLEYKRLKETLDVLSDPGLMRQIRESERYFAKGGKGLGFEEVFGERVRPIKRRARL